MLEVREQPAVVEEVLAQAAVVEVVVKNVVVKNVVQVLVVVEGLASGARVGAAKVADVEQVLQELRGVLAS